MKKVIIIMSVIVFGLTMSSCEDILREAAVKVLDGMFTPPDKDDITPIDEIDEDSISDGTPYTKMYVTIADTEIENQLFGSVGLVTHWTEDSSTRHLYIDYTEEDYIVLKLKRDYIYCADKTIDADELYIFFWLRIPKESEVEPGITYYWGDCAVESEVIEIDPQNITLILEPYGKWTNYYYNTSGWIRINKFEPDPIDTSLLDAEIEFEFEFRDKETDAMMCKVERGKIIDNPVTIYNE